MIHSAKSEGGVVRGASWIVSYLALSIVVLWLTVAVVYLYRVNGQPSALSSSDDFSHWPSKTLAPGQRLPACRGEPLSGMGTRDLGDGVEDAIFVLAGQRRSDYVAMLTAALIADERSVSLVCAIRTNGPPPTWSAELPPSIRDVTLLLSPTEFDRLGLMSTPVTGVLREGLVREAALNITDPEQARRHMAVFLEFEFQVTAGTNR